MRTVEKFMLILERKKKQLGSAHILKPSTTWKDFMDQFMDIYSQLSAREVGWQSY